MTRFLASSTKSTLIADLKTFGFEFKNEDGTTRQPLPMEIVHHNGDDCIWIGKIPAQYDSEGNVIQAESSDWCANVTSCEGHTFSTEIAEPTTPYNKFAG